MSGNQEFNILVHEIAWISGKRVTNLEVIPSTRIVVDPDAGGAVCTNIEEIAFPVPYGIILKATILCNDISNAYML